MNRAFLAASCGILSLAAVAPAGAQTIAQHTAPLASDAAALKAACESQKMQRVTLAAPAGAPSAAVDRASAAVSYWLRAPLGENDHGAEYALRLAHGRRVEISASDRSDPDVVEGGRTAINAAVAEGAFEGLEPDSAAAPVALRLFVGRTADGHRAMRDRRVCFAVPRGDNAPLLYPAELSMATSLAAPDGRTTSNVTEGSVRARFRVDSAGNVVPGTVTVLSATHPAFGREIVHQLPGFHFYPATIDGRPLAQVVEQEFDFSQSFRAGARRVKG